MATVKYYVVASDNYLITTGNYRLFALTATGSLPGLCTINKVTFTINKMLSFAFKRDFDVLNGDGTVIGAELVGDGSSANSNTIVSLSWDLPTDRSLYENLNQITIRGHDRSGSGNIMSIREGCEISITIDYTAYAVPVLDSSYPADTTVVAGKSVTLKTAIATAGYPVNYKYQWYADGKAISGATSANLTVTPSADATYYCVVSNDAGSTVSRTARVTRYYTPVLNTSYPADVSVDQGGSVTLQAKIATAGVPASYTYQWYADDKLISGATEAYLTVTPTATTYYHCEITNAAGSVATRAAKVTYKAFTKPTLSGSYPADSTVLSGTSVVLEVRIDKAGYPTAYSYQWYANGQAISGATQSSLKVTPGSTTQYYCVVSNTAGSVTSRTAKVAVQAGGNIRVGNAWAPVTVYVYTDNAWRLATPYCYSNGSWKPCSSG